MARKSNVNQEDKEAAEGLRKAGKTYKEIVEVLNGRVNIDWCKRNLSTITVEGAERVARQEIAALALRPEGVTYKECLTVLRRNGVISPFNEEEESQGEVYKVFMEIKKAVRRKNDSALFRPAWINLDDPVHSWKVMERLAFELNEKFNSVVDTYIEMVFDRLPEYASRISVAHELAMLGCDFKIIEGFTARVDRNESMARMLEERLTKKEN